MKIENEVILQRKMIDVRIGNLPRWGAGLGVALFVPLLFRRSGLATSMDYQIMALGFDAERVGLIDYLLLTLLGSTLASLLVQRRSPAWIGGGVYFVMRYLLSFIQQAQHPGPGPDGQAQALRAGALGSTVLTLLTMALLCAGAGAVIGEAYGCVLIAPLIALGKHVLARMRKVPVSPKIPSLRASLCSLLLGIGLLGLFILGAIGAEPLLVYGPTTNLYQPLQGSRTVAPLRHGILQHGTFPSPTLGGMVRTYWIYLPPSYPQRSSQRYPTFYLLHGSPGDSLSWFGGAHADMTADTLLAEGKIRETILIAADGNGPLYPVSEWANSFDRRQRMEDAIVEDLVPFIDHHYRTLADAADRAIGGLSMGGYGAVNIALHHPDIFEKVMTTGGYFQAEGPVFGTDSASQRFHQFNSPSLFLRTPLGKHNASQLMIVIGIGTTDGHYYHEGFALYQQLLTMKISVRLFISVGGHAWPLWAKHFGQALPLFERRSPL